MNRPIKKAGLFAKAEGAGLSWKERLAKAEGAGLSWKERLAKLKGKTKPKATAKLEIDDATGETLIFPEIGDVSEIAEGVTVTATDGDHVFTADSSTYTVTVLDGVVTMVIEDTTEGDTEAMSAETVEFIEAVAEALGEMETFRATAQASIAQLTTDLATANSTIATMRATMSHGGDGSGGDGGAGAADGSITVGGKKIDISKINFNAKK